ncbi:unnamed protein product [Vitrella brassicaformis CCMP3155]|uniref:Uncharacterized protein n=1 Tax=Vitrella brassicaformis (strain CCMP3155) TaxID=1169540 RepID=A0A0G4ET60_VITBC|nr:unnamed protein product [Vitrella brassicaformis CCMP3155]|eukprot:CEM01618.1 unnamed protein product [Vitrella brassicaformis CCMP3155]
MGWEVVREGGDTVIYCRHAERTEGPPTAETLKLVETIKRHSEGGDEVSLLGDDSGSGDPTSPHFSGIRFDSATRLNIDLNISSPDVAAESFNSIPLWLTEDTTLKSLSSMTEVFLCNYEGPYDGIPTCDPEYLIPPAKPNRLSRILSSLPALAHVDFDCLGLGAILASEALAYIQQGIAKPLKKLEIEHDEPLFFNRPRIKAAAPVAFPSPDTTRQYPTVEELSIEISPIDMDVGSYQDIYNARAESVPDRLRDLFRLVHEVRPSHATLNLGERADIFSAPGDADGIKSELKSLFGQGRVRQDMPEYRMEATRLAYKRFDEEETSDDELAQRPREHEWTVEMEMWPVGDAGDGEKGTEGMG